MSISVDKNFFRFLPFLNGVSRDEFRTTLLENETVTPETLEQELDIYDYIDSTYSDVFKRMNEEGSLLDFILYECDVLKRSNIVLGETIITTRMLERIKNIERDESNRVKNEALRKKRKNEKKT
ncbi:hypothetical protein A6J76_006070 [Aggregatibacter aphrophilus]|jgi:hypothetical protein|uniref:hypothetical protein n=1 Tax=Aggregatibacter aphrophilus TaxID=732 RepID=UPI0009F20461|nr:hypothetical protein [Aggregatibacter aphrophilus]PNL93543.1 hypothetical protein A6J76_006070 [Aggregatibacter aphrophilus]